MRTLFLLPLIFVCSFGYANTYDFDDCCDEPCPLNGPSIYGYPPLARTQIEFFVYENDKPTWAVETIQPYFNDPWPLCDTLFWQGRASVTGDRDTFTLGTGYRFTDGWGNWLVGVNAFYDYQRKHQHHSGSVGGELMYNQFTLRGNYYHPISTSTTIDRGEPRIKEAPIKGYDVEVEAPLPHMPWSRFAFGYYENDRRKSSNEKGWQGRITANITPSFVIEAGRMADNHKHDNYIKFGLNLGGPAEIEYTAICDWITCEMFPCRNISNWILSKVKRSTEIRKERYKIVTEVSDELEPPIDG